MSLCGVIPVLKPANLTSHDVVARVRRILGTKKVGHSGTLDPMVTGVLLLLVGNATKLSDYFMNVPKKYHATAVLGAATDTQDAQGSVVAISDCESVSRADVERCLTAFLGGIEQIPPDYSAVKIRGKKLIDYAIRGEAVPEKKARRVRIYDAVLSEFCNPRFSFSVLCSKGTYVRTLCHDIGEKLGVHAHLSELVRVSSGGFELSDALKLESLESVGAESLISIDDAARKIWNIGTIELNGLGSETEKKLKNGVRFDIGAYGEVFSAAERTDRFFGNRAHDFALSDGYFVYLDGKFFGIADNDRRIVKVVSPSM